MGELVRTVEILFRCHLYCEIFLISPLTVLMFNVFNMNQGYVQINSMVLRKASSVPTGFQVLKAASSLILIGRMLSALVYVMTSALHCYVCFGSRLRTPHLSPSTSFSYNKAAQRASLCSAILTGQIYLRWTSTAHHLTRKELYPSWIRISTN